MVCKVTLTRVLVAHIAICSILVLVIGCARSSNIKHVALSEVAVPPVVDLNQCRFQVLVKTPNPNSQPVPNESVSLFLIDSANQPTLVKTGNTDQFGLVNFAVATNKTKTFYEARLTTGERSNDLVCTPREPID